MGAGSKLITQISKAAREKIFKDMAVNAMREKLVSKVAPEVEEMAKRTAPDTRAWVFGSGADKAGRSTSGTPDLDVMYRSAAAEAPTYPFQYNSADLHVNHIPEEITPETIEMLRGVVKEGKERYGDDIQWKRILGLAMGMPAYTQTGREE